MPLAILHSLIPSRSRLLPFLFAILLCPGISLVSAQDHPEEVDWGEKAPWRQWDTPPPGGGTGREASRRAPFKIFDNAYYVGLHNVSAYLIVTSEGLVLLDSTYPDTADWVLENIKTLGFDPARLRYIFVSHAHGDHVGGAARIQQVTGARVGLSAQDWTVLERAPTPSGLKRDLVIADGEAITVGDTTFTFYVSPGHTPGSLTATFPVRDGSRTYRVLSPGGLGYNFNSDWTPQFIRSLERLKTLGPFDTLLPNHPYMTPEGLFAQVAGLEGRAPSAPHPVVIGPERVNQFLDSALALAQEKMKAEAASLEIARVEQQTHQPELSARGR